MQAEQKHIVLLIIIFLWSCVSVRANEVSVSHLLKDFYANGNPISVEDSTANTLRVMQWDEENRQFQRICNPLAARCGFEIRKLYLTTNVQ